MYIFGLVGFYGISTIVGYLMPNPLYTYVLNIFVICKRIVLIAILNELELFWHTFQWFQLLLYNCHLFVNSLFYLTQRYGRTRCYQIGSEWTVSNGNDGVLLHSPNFYL